MRYIIANTAKTLEQGIAAAAHRTKGRRILLTEKEVLFRIAGDTFDDKLAAIDGRAYTQSEITKILKREDWK